jgi:hypothetical protein
VTLSGPASATTTANSGGAYSFTGLANGSYTVTPSLAGYTYSPASQAVTINGANQTANFTASPASFTISGTISPTAGGSGAKVTLSGAASATTTANSGGTYSFTGLANGSYTVTPSLAGYSYSPASQAVTINGANQTANFTASAASFTISGTISPTTGGSGAKVTLSGAASAATTANSGGAYSFTGLANGSYTVTPSLAGYTYSPANQAVTINGANQTANFTASAASFTISGTISPTAGGSGAKVTLTGAASATTTANSSGAYSFTGLANGSYTVTPSLAGYTYSPASQAVTINGANQTANFTATPVSGTTVTGIACNPDAVIPPAASTCQVTISAAAPAGGTVVSLSDTSSNVIAPSSLTIPPGSTISSFQITTTQVMSNSTVQMTATLGASAKSVPLLLLAPPVSNGLGIDVTVSRDSPSGATITSPVFSTASQNELLLAFLSAGPGTSPTTFTNVTGGGLTWVLVGRENVQTGTSEIWRALAPVPLNNVSVTATISGSASSSMTLMGVTGVDPSGTNGSGAIGATAISNQKSGAPSVSLVTTRDGSWVMGVGNSANSAARVPGSGQNVVHQNLGASGQAFWVQEQLGPTPESGTSVTINDTAPSAAYNLIAVEVLPPASCAVASVPQFQSFGIAGGSTSVLVADGMGCNWSVSTNSPSWITIGGGAGTGNGSFTYAVAPSLGPTRLGTITVGNQPFAILESGTTVVFADTSRKMATFDYMNLMYYLGISPGCSAGSLNYCPSAAMTRGEMAALVVSALDGINYVKGGLPKSYTTTPYFADVPATNPYFPFVQRLADLNLADACQTSPAQFCPTSAETQRQIAKLMILAWMHKSNLSAFTYSLYPYFTDVPVTDPNFPYIQKMRDMNFWAGCKAAQYCPGNSVLERDMAQLVLRSLFGAPRVR